MLNRRKTFLLFVFVGLFYGDLDKQKYRLLELGFCNSKIPDGKFLFLKFENFNKTSILYYTDFAFDNVKLENIPYSLGALKNTSKSFRA